MIESKIKLTVSPEEAVAAKFHGTIALVDGYLREANANIKDGTDYSATAVRNRMNDIKTALCKDLQTMASSIRSSIEISNS